MPWGSERPVWKKSEMLSPLLEIIFKLLVSDDVAKSAPVLLMAISDMLNSVGTDGDFGHVARVSAGGKLIQEYDTYIVRNQSFLLRRPVRCVETLNGDLCILDEAAKLLVSDDVAKSAPVLLMAISDMLNSVGISLLTFPFLRTKVIFWS
jgi:hypothetical protein